MSYIGLKKAQLVELPRDQLAEARDELADYVDRLEQGGGTGNWATAHIGVYRGRLRAAEEALATEGVMVMTEVAVEVPVKELLDAVMELKRLVYKISAEEIRGTPLVPLGHEDCQWDSDYPAELQSARHAIRVLDAMLEEAGTSVLELLHDAR